MPITYSADWSVKMVHEDLWNKHEKIIKYDTANILRCLRSHGRKQMNPPDDLRFYSCNPLSEKEKSFCAEYGVTLEANGYFEGIKDRSEGLPNIPEDVFPEEVERLLRPFNFEGKWRRNFQLFGKTGGIDFCAPLLKFDEFASLLETYSIFLNSEPVQQLNDGFWQSTWLHFLLSDCYYSYQPTDLGVLSLSFHDRIYFRDETDELLNRSYDRFSREDVSESINHNEKKNLVNSINQLKILILSELVKAIRTNDFNRTLESIVSMTMKALPCNDMKLCLRLDELFYKLLPMTIKEDDIIFKHSERPRLGGISDLFSLVIHTVVEAEMRTYEQISRIMFPAVLPFLTKIRDDLSAITMRDFVEMKPNGSTPEALRKAHSEVSQLLKDQKKRRTELYTEMSKFVKDCFDSMTDLHHVANECENLVISETKMKGEKIHREITRKHAAMELEPAKNQDKFVFDLVKNFTLIHEGKIYEFPNKKGASMVKALYVYNTEYGDSLTSSKWMAETMKQYPDLNLCNKDSIRDLLGRNAFDEMKENGLLEILEKDNKTYYRIRIYKR